MLLLGENMKIKANDYRANEIIKIIREWSGKTQEEFGKEINRTKNSIQPVSYTHLRAHET